MFGERELGNTGIRLSPIGISTSFGAEQAVYEEAFEWGCNYFTWGTFIKGRSASFRDFVRSVTAAGKRDKLFIGLLSYSHSSLLGNLFLKTALEQLGIDYVDGMILGYYSKRPPQRIIDWGLQMKEKGLVKFLGITTHNRDIVASLVEENLIDYYHIRYNAVHRGAEQDIFPRMKDSRAGLISFTATCWGKLLKSRKIPSNMSAPKAADCYRFVLTREEIDCCMMGVKNQKMLRENLQGLEKGPMSDTERAEMVSIGKAIYGQT